MQENAFARYSSFKLEIMKESCVFILYFVNLHLTFCCSKPTIYLYIYTSYILYIYTLYILYIIHYMDMFLNAYQK